MSCPILCPFMSIKFSLFCVIQTYNDLALDRVCKQNKTSPSYSPTPSHRQTTTTNTHHTVGIGESHAHISRSITLGGFVCLFPSVSSQKDVFIIPDLYLERSGHPLDIQVFLKQLTKTYRIRSSLQLSEISLSMKVPLKQFYQATSIYTEND